MMDVLEIDGDVAWQEAVQRLCGSAADVDDEVNEKDAAVRAVLNAVRERGDEAVAEFTKQFDGVDLRPDQFELTSQEIDQAVARVEPALVAVLERAYGRIQAFHGKHLSESWEEIDDDGTLLGQRVTPIERVGVYVPGGKAFYPSSVLMNIVPARVAGVSEIVMVSPPSFEGSIHPAVIAAARIAGATRVFRVGGAQAIAALAFGTQRVPSVLKITGPGNTYVTLAKRYVRGVCDIDTEAGPSEVVVIADEKADPRFVAAELLAQAEHDEEARSILITPSRALAEKVILQIETEIKALSRKNIINTALAGQGVVVVVRNLEEAARLTDLIAPEHLSIQTEFPRKVFDCVQNAGAAMLGTMTPVAVGDYGAGPNHILPTGRQARYASPLTAEDFRKVTSVLSYSKERLLNELDDVYRLAQAEELTAHARAMEIRK